MARRRSRSPAQRALSLAGGATLVWIGMASVLLGPLVTPVLARALFPSLDASAAWAMPTASPERMPGVLALVVAGACLIVVWRWAMGVVRRQNARAQTVQELQALSPDAFEEWVAARLRERGYAVELTGTTGDHGVDAVARRAGEVLVVQCKKLISQAVGEPTVRDLFGAMHHARADRALIVTTTSLTPAAATWVRGKPIDVWDAITLGQVGAGGALAGETAGSGSESPAKDLDCPACGSPLVLRRNHSTGSGFLGCSSFPRCRRTLPVPGTTS